MLQAEESVLNHWNYKKKSQGFFDVKQCIRERIICGKPLNIILLTGDKVLVPEVFNKTIGQTIQHLSITILACNPSNEFETVELIKDSVGKAYDCMVLVGIGFNKNNEVCNNLELAGLLLESKTAIFTVNGYNRHKTILEQISDKRYRTLGHFAGQLRASIEGVLKSL